jgi:glycerate 2-kinase
VQLPAEMILREEALAAFHEGLKNVDPRCLIERRVKLESDALVVMNHRFDLRFVKRILVIAFGKAAAKMTSAIDSLLGERIERGIVLSNNLSETLPNKYMTFECNHPLPGEANLEAGQEVLGLAGEAGEKDLVLCLISGGGSSILTVPARGIGLDELREATRLLLQAGSPIEKLNSVRKHLSVVKGGLLAKAIAPAIAVGLILSDVPGDDPTVVASGPISPDPSTFADALRAVEDLGVAEKLPHSVSDYLRRGANGRVPETPKPGDPVFNRVSNFVIGSNRDMLSAMEDYLRKRGFWTMQEREYFRGEARLLGTALSERVKELSSHLSSASRPYALMAGGESTVSVAGDGLGGRNSELALAAAIGLDGCGDCLILAAGTDGIDGPTDAAGALASGDSIERARKISLDAEQALENNDSYRFFAPLGDLIITGQTGTNLMDVTLALVGQR